MRLICATLGTDNYLDGFSQGILYSSLLEYLGIQHGSLKIYYGHILQHFPHNTDSYHFIGSVFAAVNNLV